MPRNYIAQDKIDHEFMFLIEPETNKKLFIDLTGGDFTSVKNQVRHPMPPNYDLIRIENSVDQFVIALVDFASEAVVYYIRANVWQDVFLSGKPVTQVLLWRTGDVRHKSVTSGLPQDVFFNYLLEEYNVIASDSHQTTEGRQFWIDKLGEAMLIGLHVYRYHRVYCDLKEIEDHVEIRTNRCDLWGDDEDYQNVLAIISKDKLPKVK